MTLRSRQPSSRRGARAWAASARAGRRVGRPALGTLAAALLAGAGCGYGFAVGGPGFPDGVPAVYVPVFANRSSEPEAGAFFSEALAETLAREGRAAGPFAPARIDGEVVSLVASPAATMRDGRGVGIYRLTGMVRLSLVRDGRELCRRDFTGAEDYLPAENLLGLDANRRDAVRRLAERMMRSAGRELCPR